MKLSRDTTIGSKRLIFLLHRYFDHRGCLIPHSGLTITERRFMDNPTSITEQADADLVKVRENLDRIAAEIDGHDYFRYLRSFSPGLQEYMEAVSFYYFLKHRDLITKKQIEDDIQNASPTVHSSTSHRQSLHSHSRIRNGG